MERADAGPPSLQRRTLETGKVNFQDGTRREGGREGGRQKKQTATQGVVQTPWPGLRHVLFQCVESESLREEI